MLCCIVNDVIFVVMCCLERRSCRSPSEQSLHPKSRRPRYCPVDDNGDGGDDGGGDGGDCGGDCGGGGGEKGRSRVSQRVE